MISSVWSAYSIELLYLTDGAKSGFLLDELDAAAADPALGDAGALAAEEDDRRVLHERTLIAPAMLAMPGPSVPMHRPGLPVMRDAASAMNPALSS